MTDAKTAKTSTACATNEITNIWRVELTDKDQHYGIRLVGYCTSLDKAVTMISESCRILKYTKTFDNTDKSSLLWKTGLEYSGMGKVVRVVEVSDVYMENWTSRHVYRILEIPVGQAVAPKLSRADATTRRVYGN